MTSRSDNIDQIEAKLDRLGLRLPKRINVPSGIRTPPAWVLRRGDKVYISGHGPQNPDGSVAEPFGKVGAEVSIEQGYESAKLAGLSILGSLKQELGSLYLVTAWLQVRVMINTIPGFTLTTDVANGFSDLILKLYGPKIGMHARSAIGVEALPMNLPVIIEGLVEIVPWSEADLAPDYFQLMSNRTNKKTWPGKSKAKGRNHMFLKFSDSFKIKQIHPTPSIIIMLSLLLRLSFIKY